MEETGDAELMAATARGDEDAFAQLVARHQHLVYGTVVRMLGMHRSEAEDVAQQIFIRVFKAAGRYQPEAKFTTWLLTICRNCVFTQLKKQGRWKKEEPWQDEEGKEVHPLDCQADVTVGNAGEHLLRQELEDAIQRAMSDLPESQRMALILRQYDQLDYEEIAKVLGTTVPSVKSLLFRARETLRKALHSYLHATH
jgi:RNA polymerase sigma-70 factor (ECF subfamily)